jgi:ATP-dependent Clp protease adaptor protein ClpS
MEARPEAPAKDSAGARSVSTAPEHKPTVKPPRFSPPWKVILHNDDHNEFEAVVKIIRRLTPLSEQEAFLRTLEAHESGAALLLMTHQERAELYIEQFASCGLTVTAEPDA